MTHTTITATLTRSGEATIEMFGDTNTTEHGDLPAARKATLDVMTAVAVDTGTDQEVHIIEPTGSHRLIVSPQGQTRPSGTTAAPLTPAAPAQVVPAPAVIEDNKDAAPAEATEEIARPQGAVIDRVPGKDSTPTPAPMPMPEDTSAVAAAVSEVPAPLQTPPGLIATATGAPQENTTQENTTAAVEPAPASTRRSLREAESFLTTQASAQPADHGFRGWLSSIGIRMAPSAREVAQRIDIDAVSRHWPGTRTVMIANRKGGANKTPTVKNLAAIFARYGGGGVLAYDGNPEVGTLGWRTEQAEHCSTVLDVLDNSEALLSTDAVSGHMARYVHHQPADKFDVLRSDDSLVGTHVMTGDDVDLIHRVAAKYYRLIVMDSGNVDRGSDWARMISHTNQLVVPTTTMEDRAEAALLTLRALQERDEDAAALAENAVVIVSQWQPGENAMAERIAEGFRPYVRDVVTVPYDPALKSGRIVHDALAPATQRAWLCATAAVARGL